MVIGNLPDGWEWTAVENLVNPGKGSIKRGPFGSAVKKAYFVPDGYKIYEQQNVIHNDFTLGNYFIDESRFRELQAFEVQPGDLLITGAGTIGKVAVVPENIQPGIINQALLKLSLNKKSVNTKFFIYYFEVKLREYLLAQTRGSAMQNISSVRDLKVMQVPLPPLPEQERIVAKIEELFTQLDAGTSALEKVQAGLRRYKASVLKAAVEGKLLGNREFENSGELPEGWRLVTLPDIGHLGRGKSKHRPRNAEFLYGGNYPFVQTGDIRHADGIITSYTQTYSEAGLAQSKLWKKGTLCITIAANIAETAILGIDACFPDSVVGFIPNGDIDVKFVEFYIRTIKDNLERYAPATAQKNINLDVLQKVDVPLPQLEEQRRIVAEVERRLSVAREVESVVEKALVRAARLRQAVLKSAFEGKLR